jgi:hypothetical protein
MKNVNGFLYLIGDSSMNYLTGVTTTASGTTSITTFNINNQNVDPQIGSPWPSSVQVFSRNIVFANTVGIFSSAGGAIEKVSTPLDGFYGSGPIFGNTSNFSSAVATIFNMSVYMLLLPVVDQFTGQQVNKLLMYDGKRFFTSQQDRNMIYIASQEINSVLTAWGTDGFSIFPLFQQPTTSFQKVMQSKLYSTPAYYITKTSRTLTGILQSFAVDDPLNITIDSELGLGTGNALISVVPALGGAVWLNGSMVTLTWNITWMVAAGLDVFGPVPVGQSGRLFGLTVSTTAADVAIVSFTLAEQSFATNL